MQAFTLSFTSFSPGAFAPIGAPWRRSKTEKCGEGKSAKSFTLYALRMNELRPTGEDVKAKKRKAADVRVYARALAAGCEGA